jgi:hypothetical protein
MWRKKASWRFSRLGVAVTGTLLGGVDRVPLSEDVVVDILGDDATNGGIDFEGWKRKSEWEIN